jgi:hypothetical protein
MPPNFTPGQLSQHALILQLLLSFASCLLCGCLDFRCTSLISGLWLFRLYLLEVEVGSYIVTGERLESADLIKANIGHLLSCPLHLLDARTEVTQSALLLEYLVGMTHSILGSWKVEEYGID